MIINTYLEETRSMLYDNRFNFMGLSDPKEIDFLNF